MVRVFVKVAAVLLFQIVLVAGAQAFDYEINFSNTTSTGSYLIDNQGAVSPEVYSGPFVASDATLTLELGRRYRVTVVDTDFHPFQVISKAGSSAGDVVLMSQLGTVGTLELDVGINWVDDGQINNGAVEFTVTQTLINAMNSGGRVPGYRCTVHASMMRGNFNVLGADPIADPLPDIPLGGARIELVTVASGFTSPLRAIFPDDGTDRMFVVDQTGVVTGFDSGGSNLGTFMDVSANLVTLNPGYDERGLLGLAFHPNFDGVSGPGVRKVYTYTSEPVSGSADFAVTSGTPNHDSVISEWTIDSGDPNVIDATPRRVLLTIEQPQSNHNGGDIAFGPDDLLYIALGDGGSADDEGDGHGTIGNGQDPTTIWGSILRIDVDGNNSTNSEYGIPGGNPALGGEPEIYAYGFRNPYSMSFDSMTGDLYVGDVGQNDIEEVDIVVNGGNYGWRVREGSFFFDPNGAGNGFVRDSSVVLPVPSGLIDPIAEYDHDDGLAIVGGAVVRSTDLPSLNGGHVFGEFSEVFGSPQGRLLYLEANAVRELRIGFPIERPLGLFVKGFAHDTNGNVYVLGTTTLGPTGTTGVVQKLVSLESQGIMVPAVRYGGILLLALLLIAFAAFRTSRLQTKR